MQGLHKNLLKNNDKKITQYLKIIIIITLRLLFKDHFDVLNIAMWLQRLKHDS